MAPNKIARAITIDKPSASEGKAFISPALAESFTELHALIFCARRAGAIHNSIHVKITPKTTGGFWRHAALAPMGFGNAVRRARSDRRGDGFGHQGRGAIGRARGAASSGCPSMDEKVARGYRVFARRGRGAMPERPVALVRARRRAPDRSGRQ